MNYANGGNSSDPDVVMYGICAAFHKLPSEVDAEDPAAVERLAYVHYVVESVRAARERAEAAKIRKMN